MTKDFNFKVLRKLPYGFPLKFANLHSLKYSNNTKPMYFAKIINNT